MDGKKLFANTIWGIGTAVTAVLCAIVLLRVDIVLNPDAMLPMQLWEQATKWLAVGFLPMLIACIGAYRVNGIKNRKHVKRDSLLVFLPGILCFLSLVFWIGTWMLGMLNMGNR